MGGSVLFLDHLTWQAHPTVSGGAGENWITASEQSAFHTLSPQLVYELGTDWKGLQQENKCQPLHGNIVENVSISNEPYPTFSNLFSKAYCQSH